MNLNDINNDALLITVQDVTNAIVQQLKAVLQPLTAL